MHKRKSGWKFGKWAWALAFGGIACCVWMDSTWCFLKGDEPTKRKEEATQPADKTPAEQLSAIRKILFTGGKNEANQVDADLKKLETLELSQSDRETWVRLARDVAIRQGDRSRLETLRNVPDTFSTDMIYTILLASGQLAKADLAGARTTLDKVTNLDLINEREKRRIYSIRARIAQLEGNEQEEREYINKLVDHLYLWSKPICQSCHSNPADNKAIPQMPITNLWFGERYVELLRKQGDAKKIREEAEAKLKSSPGNEKARIQLAFALLALKNDAEAEKQFRMLPWAAFTDRDLRKPRMMTTFP